MFRKPIFTFVTLLLPALVSAESGASWLRTAVSNALNPKISVIADLLYQSGPQRTKDQFDLREAELALQSEIDPNTRADVYFAYHEEQFELEEGYFTLLSLPLGFQARAGKFLANFGRLNMVHTHELPFVNQPLAITDFLGEEGLNDTGGELSRVFAPFGIFTEVSYAFLNGLGEEHHGEAATTTVMDTSSNTVTVAVQSEEEATERTISNFAHVARIRTFADLTDSLGLDIGVSGAYHHPRHHSKKKLGGADLTLKWKPPREGQYKSVTWRTEGIWSNWKLEEETNAVTGAVSEVEGTQNRFGGYSYVEIQPARSWRFGVLGEYNENPEERGRLKVTRGVSPFVTFNTSEFSRFRVQYDYRDVSQQKKQNHVGYVQWTVVMGPHGAHPY